MRRLGMGLVVLGLAALLVALLLEGAGVAAANRRAVPYLDAMFYAGIAACIAGLLVFTVRVMLARRGRG